MEDQNEDESPKKSTLWQVGMIAQKRQRLPSGREDAPAVHVLGETKSPRFCLLLYSFIDFITNGPRVFGICTGIP